VKIDMTAQPQVLHVELDRSVLLDGRHGPATIATSPHDLAARHWPDGRPRPLQLEQAIDDVENAIEQSRLRHEPRGMLIVGASLLAMLPQRFHSAARFGRDDVEAEFSRLVSAASAANGGAGLAVSGEAAAAVLMLRELMHHLGFQSFTAEGQE
jgi:hypothetical protein